MIWVGLVELAADRGADVIGLNPLHAMFPDDPEHASPYSPASRLLLNVLNIDVTAVPELLHCPEMRDSDRLRSVSAEGRCVPGKAPGRLRPSNRNQAFGAGKAVRYLPR